MALMTWRRMTSTDGTGDRQVWPLGYAAKSWSVLEGHACLSRARFDLSRFDEPNRV